MNWMRTFNPLFLLRSNPQYLILFVTARCNCRCSMCFNLDRIRTCDPKEELRLEELESLARAYGPVANLSLSGGEPMLRPDLPDVVRTLARHMRPRVVEIPTNGSMPAEVAALAETLCREFPDIVFEVELSVDGPREVHERIRGLPGLYDRVQDANRRLAAVAGRHANLRVHLISVYAAYNRAELPAFFSGIRERFFFHRLILNRLHGAPPEALAGTGEEEFQALRAQVEALPRQGRSNLTDCFRARALRALRRLDREWDERRDLGRYCQAGRGMLVIGERGDVYPCEPLWFRLGNVRDTGYDVRPLLRGDRAQEFRETYLKGAQPCHCTWGCARANALVSNPRYWWRMLA